MSFDKRELHNHQVAELEKQLAGNTQPLKVKKRTISNLFRYDGRQAVNARLVDLSGFNQPLYIDKKTQTLEVQGLTTYEAIVRATLPHGLLPQITPELKHITIGGATVGIGIETNSFRYGFVHDGVLEADVLLPEGKVITCSPSENSDLFHGLPNSYGTLGYILRVKLQLRKAKPFVILQTKRYHDTGSLIKALEKAGTKDNDYVESLLYSPNELYLTTVKEVDTATNIQSIYGNNSFYRAISRPGEFTLPTLEYMFRYDPDWFWAVPHGGVYDWFRHFAPRSIRNSGFYARLERWQGKLPFLPEPEADLEKLIQDWEVPIDKGKELLDFALENIDLDGKPLMCGVINTPGKASCYPFKPGKNYFNLGSYNLIRRKPGTPKYEATKRIDQRCFELSGIKMLYSSSFIEKSDFNKRYNGKEYARLKRRYDPKKLLPELYEKAVRSF